ncbi:MAG TPA: hypothetical protein VMM92_15955 [Thermoanaerobaculia bacterium]|nr:hypothetical protein [Thermoanaerobaculia bacterium]
MNANPSLLFLPSLPALQAKDGRPSRPADIQALERRLRQAALQGRPVLLGTPAAPYEPAERGTTRFLLATLGRTEGLEVVITTRSPLLLRDLELLTRLDRCHAVIVRMMLPTVDPELAVRMEPEISSPQSRLRAVRQLSEEGIETQVLCAPWLPGSNDSEAVLRPLFAAAWEAGAFDVRLPGDRRSALAAWTSGGRDRRLAVFRRLRLEYGFPRPLAGRG